MDGKRIVTHAYYKCNFPVTKKHVQKLYVLCSKPFQTIATLGKKKETKTCLKDNLPLYGLNVIKDGPTIGRAQLMSLFLYCLGLRLWVQSFTLPLHFCAAKPRIGEPRKKGKFAGHLSFVAKQPCGSVNQLQLRINIRKSPHFFMHTLLPKGIKLFFCAERFEIYFLAALVSSYRVIKKFLLQKTHIIQNMSITKSFKRFHHKKHKEYSKHAWYLIAILNYTIK